MTTRRRLPAVAALAVAVAMVLSSLGVAAASGASRQVANASQYDDEIADYNAQREEQEQALNDIEHQLEDTDAAIVDADRQLRELNLRLPEAQRELEIVQMRLDAAVLEQQQVAARLAAARAQDEALTEQIAADAARLAQLQADVAQFARQAYQNAGDTSSLEIAFGASTADDVLQKYTVRHSAERIQTNALAEMEQIAAVNRNRATRQEGVREFIEVLQERADALVEELAVATKLAEERKAEIEALLVKQTQLRAFLESKREEFLAQQAEIEAANDALRIELERLVRKKLESETAGARTPLGREFLSYPTANPYITSSYGYRIHPIYGVNRLHAGTDFRAYCGTPIYAAADGKVEWAKYLSGFGNQVMLDHGIQQGNVLFTSYNHLTSFAVSSGQIVLRGDLVGYAGTTGSSTACHLHFEVYVNGQTVDPMSVL